MNPRSIRAGLMGLALAASVARAERPDGLYAEFQTSMGTFTCRLEMEQAPRIVANFVGLATGERAWLSADGRVRTAPFYDGLMFHRVVAGFMIQSGSPNGEGTDDPGYAVLDEFDPALRHDAAGVLSMANTGPNSNGSQFFVTVADTAWLDDVHCVFGRVVEGLDVVTAISQVGTDAEDRPVTPVVLQNVRIQRVGAAAQAFDVNAHALPVVTGLRAGLSVTGADAVTVDFTREAFTAYRLYESPDLDTWTGRDLGIEPATPRPNGVSLDISGRTKEFYALSRVKYAASTRAPPEMAGRTLTLNFNDGIGQLVIVFNASGGGAYQYEGANGTVDEYAWYQDPYRGFLWPIYFSGLVPMTLRLDFDGDTAGVFSGTAYTEPSLDVSGAFTLETE